jgi:hypothetical protein
VQASTATIDAAATHTSQLAITNASVLAAMTNERNAAVTVRFFTNTIGCVMIMSALQMSETMTNERNAAVMVRCVYDCLDVHVPLCLGVRNDDARTYHPASSTGSDDGRA